MFRTTSRLERKIITIKAMLGFYCRAHHEGTGNALCEECSALLD